jgi:hypothetical protein
VADEEIWIGPRIQYLNKLIKMTHNGESLTNDDIKGIEGLKVYVNKKMPGFEKIRAKLNELGGSSSMSDDDEDQYLQTGPKTLFGEKYQQRGANEPPAIGSTKEAIDWCNKYYAAIIIGGKFRILRERNDEIEFMTKRDFMDSLENIRITITNEKGDRKYVSIAEIWVKHEKRRNYNDLVFDLSHVGNYDEKYNLWKGYKIEPKEGDVTPFMGLMNDTICSENGNSFNYLDEIVSQMLQFPDEKPGIAVVIRGDEGVGKSFFVERLCDLMAPYYFKTSNPSYIFGDHNGQLKDKILLHLEEAVWAGSKKDESLLKDLITGHTIEINDKFVPVYSVPNHLHLFITGNPLWTVSASFTARRMFALHASNKHRRDIEYFANLSNWFRNGGNAALLYYFLHHKINTNLRIVQVTDELIIQKQQSMYGVPEWWFSIVDTREMPYGELQPDGNVYVIKNLLYQSYINSSAGKRYQYSESKFGILFSSLFPKVINGEEQTASNGRVANVFEKTIKIADSRGIQRNGYDIPKNKDCRDLMKFKLGGNCSWNSDGDDNGDGGWSVLKGNSDYDFSLYK